MGVAPRAVIVGGRQEKKTQDRMICFCYSVAESEIVKAIEAGAETLMDIRRMTYANTGCAGCANEVKKLLNKHVPRVRALKEQEAQTTPPKEGGK